MKQHSGNTYHEAYSYCYIYTDMNIKLLRKFCVLNLRLVSIER